MVTCRSQMTPKMGGSSSEEEGITLTRALDMYT